MPIKKRIVTFRKQRTKKLNNIKMEGQILLRVIAFLYNKNINLVGKIYLDKVPDVMVAHLIDRAQRARAQYNNNELGWIDFILGLDSENRQILTEYVFNNK